MKFLKPTENSELAEKLELVRPSLSAEIFRQMKLCVFPKGEFIFREGEEAEFLYIILSGNCRVFKTLENGKIFLICCYKDIQVLGEFELFGGTEAKTSIQALSDTFCLAISAVRFQELLLSDIKFLQFVCRHTCAKVERNNVNTGINLLYTLEQRLAGYVLVMQNNGLFSENHTMVAEYLGCSHRHLLRTLNLLCEHGGLEKAGTAYRVLDFAALEALAGEVYRQ